jgi:hypothetical protein
MKYGLVKENAAKLFFPGFTSNPLHRGIRHGVSKGVEDSRRLYVLRAATPWREKETQGIVGPSNKLRSPWPPLALRPCRFLLQILSKDAIYFCFLFLLKPFFRFQLHHKSCPHFTLGQNTSSPTPSQAPPVTRPHSTLEPGEKKINDKEVREKRGKRRTKLVARAEPAD